MKINILKRDKNRYVKRISVSVLVVGFLIALFPYVFDLFIGQKTYPNVYIGKENFGLLTKEEARKKLKGFFRKSEIEGFEFVAGENRVLVASTITSLGDPDLSYSLVDFDYEKTLDNILSVKKEKNLFKKWAYVYRLLFDRIYFPVEFEVDKKQMKEVLKDNLTVFEQPPRDASIEYSKYQGYVIKKEKIGTVFDYESAVDELVYKIGKLDFSPIEVKKLSKNPSIYFNESLDAVEMATEIEKIFPIKIFYDDDRRDFFIMSVDEFRKYISLKKENNTVVLGFSDNMSLFLESISEKVNQEPKNAKFEIDDKTGKVVQFQESQPGYAVNIDETIKKISDDVFKKRNKQTFLVVEKVQPQYTTKDVNDLGIKELIGIGRSNFAGSPKNRVHNIEVASEKLNGLLIKPGEEFSLVKALKPFTEQAGYLPELVIKGNKLVPELGGGACQIGTTLFRAVLSAGLDITERRNHSFAVSYYSDEYGLPGTDATIYDPKPDFRFINDTDDYILIRTKIEKNGDLVYELWGANDGRKSSISKTEILSTTPAPSTKYIETADLPKGETECTGSNVPGYTTEFLYTVEKDGVKKEKVFKSYYKPWQKICLVGIGE